MKSNMILSLSIVALLTVACSQSDDESAKTTTAKSLSDKAATAVSNMKDTTMKAADEAMDKGKEIKEVVTDKAKSAAEVASTFVKKGSSKVVTVVEDAKEGLSTTVDTVKEKAADMLSDSPTTKAIPEDSSLAAVKATSKPAVETATTADMEAGKAVYSGKCLVCHGSGAAGAPKLDDDSWPSRKAQGMDVMVEHALKGYQGAKGVMPAKGGFMGLSDAEVSAAVAYMVSEAK